MQDAQLLTADQWVLISVGCVAQGEQLEGCLKAEHGLSDILHMYIYDHLSDCIGLSCTGKPLRGRISAQAAEAQISVSSCQAQHMTRAVGKGAVAIKAGSIHWQVSLKERTEVHHCQTTCIGAHFPGTRCIEVLNNCRVK